MIRRMHPPSPEGGGSVAEAERGDRGGVTRRFSFTPPRRLRSLRSLRRRPSPLWGPLRNSEQEESNRSWNENGSDSKRVCCSRFPPFRNGSLWGEGRGEGVRRRGGKVPLTRPPSAADLSPVGRGEHATRLCITSSASLRLQPGNLHQFAGAHAVLLQKL